MKHTKIYFVGREIATVTVFAHYAWECRNVLENQGVEYFDRKKAHRENFTLI